MPSQAMWGHGYEPVVECVLFQWIITDSILGCQHFTNTVQILFKYCRN